jgi:hypothetical protein
MMLDDPLTKAEVEAAFAAYESALVTNDIVALDNFFLASEGSIRYGVGENLYGYDAIKAFRKSRSPAGLARELEKTRIVAYGRECAIAATLFRRDPAKFCLGSCARRRVSPACRVIRKDLALVEAEN